MDANVKVAESVCLFYSERVHGFGAKTSESQGKDPLLGG